MAIAGSGQSRALSSVDSGMTAAHMSSKGDMDMNTRTFLGGFAVMALLGASTAAFAYTGQEFAPQAKITLDQARTIATKARPGKITDQELEKESGGSGLRYSFDVKSDKITYEVGVDAKTGKVLENDREGANPD